MLRSQRSVLPEEDRVAANAASEATLTLLDVSLKKLELEFAPTCKTHGSAAKEDSLTTTTLRVPSTLSHVNSSDPLGSSQPEIEMTCEKRKDDETVAKPPPVASPTQRCETIGPLDHQHLHDAARKCHGNMESDVGWPVTFPEMADEAQMQQPATQPMAHLDWKAVSD